MLTKGEVRELVRDLVDDPDGERWRDRSLDSLIGIVLDDLWSQLLTMAPYALWHTQQLTPDVNGFASLVPADLDRRFFRVLKAAREEEQLWPLEPKDLAFRGLVYVGPQSAKGYSILGQSLLVLPVSQDPVSLTYSYLPMRFNALEVDADVEWPDGMEAAYLHEVAGRMMTKGGAEDGSMHLQIAARSLQAALALVQRRYPAPLVIHSTSSASDFGGT
jgi:hypothetical protein